MSDLHLDPEKMLLSITDGNPLNEQEINYIIELIVRFLDTTSLARPPSIDDLYSYIRVLAKAHAYKSKSTLESLLEYHDTLTAALVLETLCLEWKFFDEYIERVIQFAVGVSWDPEEDLKQIALKILGEFLFDSMSAKISKKPNYIVLETLTTKELLALDFLYTSFYDSTLEFWSRQTAYYGLCRAVGIPWEVLPAECVALD